MVEIFLKVLFYFSLKAADSFLSSFFAGSLLFLLGITFLVLFLFLSEVKIAYSMWKNLFSSRY